MGNQVVKLAQPGYDVKTAGDENLIYSSEWPLLKIYKQGSFKHQGGGSLETIFEHNLGYPPVCWSFSNSIIQNAVAPSGFPFTIGERAMISGRATFVDKQKLYFSSIADPSQTYYYIFALDLTTPYKAPIINQGKQPEGTPSRTVFKIAKEGKSITSNNLEDYVLHSQCRSPLIHAVVPSVTSSDSAAPTGYNASVTYTHNLGYVPLHFVYQKSASSDTWSLKTGNAAFADKQIIVIYSTDVNTNFSLVVLKDPFVISNTVTVNV